MGGGLCILCKTVHNCTALWGGRSHRTLTQISVMWLNFLLSVYDPGHVYHYPLQNYSFIKLVYSWVDSVISHSVVRANRVNCPLSGMLMWCVPDTCLYKSLLYHACVLTATQGDPPLPLYSNQVTLHHPLAYTFRLLSFKWHGMVWWREGGAWPHAYVHLHGDPLLDVYYMALGHNHI